MLVVVAFDAVSARLVDRLVDEGRLPTLAALRERGTTIPLTSAADWFPASVYPTLYTGVGVARSGLYYPFQWLPAEQTVRYIEAFPMPTTIWDRLFSAGRRVLVIDPYESPRPRRVDGLFVTGWQLRNRVVLPGRSSPANVYRRLTRRFGRAPLVDEVLGTPSPSMLLPMRRRLLAAPSRVTQLAVDAVSRDRFDLVWLSFPSTHLAGHQFWDSSALAARSRRREVTSELDGTLEAVYEAADAAIGATLAALPERADVIVFSALGMNANTSRSDFLPAMLDAVLSGRRRERRRVGAPGDALWRLRATVPTEVRAAVAARLPRSVVLGLTARLELARHDWSNVRAFPLPSDSAGYVRLNVRGREREGAVDPADVDPLVEEIRQGLTSFTDPDGSRAVASVDRVPVILGEARSSDLLPDLVVRWSERPSARLTHLRSARYGDVTRHGGGSGRSGNHDHAAWATVAAAASRVRRPAAPPSIASIPASVLAAFGIDLDGIDGEPLLEPR
jgi:predicted AlkP superfamily phosphohydrolase/phosphomutase